MSATVPLDDLMGLLAMLGAGVATLAATTRWLLGKIDKTDAANGNRVARLHDRLDQAYQVFAPRDDMNRHVERIETAVNSIESKVDTNAADVTRRLEAIQRDLAGYALNHRRRDVEG